MLACLALPFLTGCPAHRSVTPEDTTPLGSAPAGETMLVAIPSLGISLDVPAASDVVHVGEGATIYTAPGARNPRAISIEQWPSPPIHPEAASPVVTKKLSSRVTIDYEVRALGGDPGSGGEESHLYGKLSVNGELFAVHCHDQGEPPEPAWCLPLLATAR